MPFGQGLGSIAYDGDRVVRINAMSTSISKFHCMVFSGCHGNILLLYICCLGKLFGLSVTYRREVILKHGLYVFVLWNVICM